jgi:hypothetical protein
MIVAGPANLPNRSLTVQRRAREGSDCPLPLVARDGDDLLGGHLGGL